MQVPDGRAACGFVAVMAVMLFAGCTEPTPAVRSAPIAWHVRGVAGPGRPAVDDRTVYFIADADSHAVHAFDLVTGTLRWSASTGISGPGRFNVTGCAVSPLTVICGEGRMSSASTRRTAICDGQSALASPDIRAFTGVRSIPRGARISRRRRTTKSSRSMPRPEVCDGPRRLSARQRF